MNLATALIGVIFLCNFLAFCSTIFPNCSDLFDAEKSSSSSGALCLTRRIKELCKDYCNRVYRENATFDIADYETFNDDKGDEYKFAETQKKFKNNLEDNYAVSTTIEQFDVNNNNSEKIGVSTEIYNEETSTSILPTTLKAIKSTKPVFLK